MYIFQMVASIIMLIMLFTVTFLSIYLVLKMPGNKKLSSYKSEEEKRKEKAELKKFMKVYIVAIMILVIAILLVIYAFFM